MKKFLKIAAGVVFFAGVTVLSGCGAEQAKAQQDTQTEVEAEADEEVRTDAETEKQAEASTEKEAVSETAIGQEPLMGEFTTMTLEGEDVTQDIFGEANLTMVNIWGTFCGPCIQEMPDLGELADEYKDRMQMLGLISDVGDAGNADAVEIVELTKADYTHLINSIELMQGYMGTVQLIPTTVFVDKDGKQVGETYTGAKSKEQWAEIIEEMLALVEV